jgi:hypothetical protein
MNWTPSATSSTGFTASDPPWDLEVDESDHRNGAWEWTVLRGGHLIGTNHASTADLAKGQAERFTKSDADLAWEEIVQKLGNDPLLNG